MMPIERAGFLAHARTQIHQSRVARARALIENALARPGIAPWCVAFSGGKDSAVALDLVRARAPDIPVAWMDDGWDYPETIQFIEETERRLGRRILRIEVPVSAPFWKTTPYPGDDPARAHPVDMSLDDWQRSYSVFIGLRAGESNDRRRTLRRNGPLYYNKSWQHWQCCPLADWDDMDVWAYIVAHDLPYNAVYDRLASMDVPLKYRRVGPLTAYMVWQYGAVSTLRQGWPDLYRRFLRALPEISRWT